MHDLTLIATLSAALAAALVLGYITHRLKLSPIVGYLLAGVAIGPHTPGFVADVKLAGQLAEVGVILLMFGVGLHFRLKDLLVVKAIAIPGAIGQSVLATLLGVLVAHGFGWNLGQGLVLGVGISVASTVVLMRVLMDNNSLDTPPGHVAVGWLVVEDIFTVVVLVLMPALAHTTTGAAAAPGGVLLSLGEALLKIVLLGVVMLVVGARVIPWVLMQVARTRSRELFTLTILVLAIAIAAASATVFGVSMALGAFLAGMVVGQSKLSHQAAADALPMRDAFAVLFFVSVGMLFDPSFLVQRPLLVLAVVGIILIGKPLAALAIVSALGYSARTALTVAIGLAQIGEFSFILAELGKHLGIFPGEGQSVIVAGALISITLNPLLFRAVNPVENWLRGRKTLWRLMNRRVEARGTAGNARTRQAVADHQAGTLAVVVGYGPVGQTLTRLLREFEITVVVIDLNVDTVTKLADEGRLAIYGDASRDEILQAAGIEKATYLLITLPDITARVPVIVAARAVNPQVKILVRARYLKERAMLEEVGATAVCYEEAEAAVAMAQTMLAEVGADVARVNIEARKIRDEFSLRPWHGAAPASEGRDGRRRWASLTSRHG